MYPNPIGDVLHALGEAWRSDWSDFDGRTLRSQLDDIAAMLTADANEVEDLKRAFFIHNEICEKCYSWKYNCSC